MQADPIKPKLEPPGTMCLKVKCSTLLSNSAFKSNLRRYTKVMVFFNSCESVEFHYKILSWLAAGGKSKQASSDRGTSGAPWESTGGGADLATVGYTVFRLHGVLSQADRKAVYQGMDKSIISSPDTSSDTSRILVS